jgi:hypothetical protein
MQHIIRESPSANSRASVGDIAMLGQSIEERRGHPGIAENGGAFPEDQVGGEDDRGLRHASLVLAPHLQKSGLALSSLLRKAEPKASQAAINALAKALILRV